MGNQSIIVATRNLYTAVATTAYSAIIAIKNSEILNAGNNVVLNYSGLSSLCATSVHCLSVVLLQDGWTSLHRAAEYGHTATVSLLLERGADIGTKSNVSNLT